MNDRLMRIAFPVNWKALENFYKDVDGGLEKVERMKKSCKIERNDRIFMPLDGRMSLEPVFVQRHREYGFEMLLP